MADPASGHHSLARFGGCSSWSVHRRAPQPSAQNAEEIDVVGEDDHLPSERLKILNDLGETTICMMKTVHLDSLHDRVIVRDYHAAIQVESSVRPGSLVTGRA